MGQDGHRWSQKPFFFRRHVNSLSETEKTQEEDVRAIEPIWANDLACEGKSASVTNGVSSVSKSVGSIVKDSKKLKTR